MTTFLAYMVATAISVMMLSLCFTAGHGGLFFAG